MKTKLVLCCVSIVLALQLQAQTSPQMVFGKNRVQYHHHFDEWSLYETTNFTTYWYGDARNVAQSALQMAELDFSSVQRLLEHQPTEKIEMLVFSDLTDLKQSNIGEDDVFQIQSGETKVVGNKVFVYFNGNHQHLRAQIREGVAGILLNSMLYGANLQEIVSNAVLLNLPPWFTQGLTAYCGEEWGPKQDNQLRDLLLTGRYKNFDRLARENPRFAGHAFWYYINMHFGRGTISNLLYLTRINRSVDNGFFYVLGSGYRRTTDAMLEYFRKRYQDESQFLKAADENKLIAVKNKKKLPLLQAKLSPDGKRLAWISNDIGKWKLWMLDLETNKKKQLAKGGARNALQATDYDYPQIAWNPDNQRLALLTEQRDVPKLTLIEVANGKKTREILSPEFQRVYNMDFISRSDLALSAEVRGFSDLFIYHSITRQTERVTFDFWDDLDVSSISLEGHKYLIFSSNRVIDTLSTEKMDTVLPVGNMDIFLYDLESRSPELIRLSNTPHFNETQPIAIDSATFSFISDESGVLNRQAGRLEDFVAYTQANIYLKDGPDAKALATDQPINWPLERILVYLSPLDSVLVNIDSAQIDSIRFQPVYKKRPLTWNQTNYDRNLQDIHSAARVGKLLEVIPKARKTHFYISRVDSSQRQTARITRWREQMLLAAGLPLPIQPPLEISDTSGQSHLQIKNLPFSDTLPDIQPGWLFQIPDYLNTNTTQANKVEPERPAPSASPAVLKADTLPPVNRRNTRNRTLGDLNASKSVVPFYPFKIIPYRLRFRTDYISTDMDNSQMFDGLQLYEGPGSRLYVPPPGVLLRANFKDLLENYVIEAGIRLPITFNGAEYYLWMDDKKKRIDKRYLIYRRTFINNVERALPYPPNLPPDYQERTVSLLGQYEMKYPLDVFTSLRGAFSLREDKVRALSSDANSLDQPDRSEQRAAVRLSAVFDNTVDIDINLKTGTRAKFYTDVIKRFSFNTEPNWSLKFNKGFMTVVGLDARHYQMLDRRSQLALRVAGATSFGSERMLYILGGVDNWIFPKFNESIQLPDDAGFAYQAPAVHLRGFRQNIRNGNSYLLINSELRIPIFKYFSKKPVMGNFWRNFQLVGFFDAGTAWQGRSPFGGDNPINIVYLEKGPDNQPPIITMRVNYFRDPVVGGMGVGLRTLLFGMYLRADYAWGIESRVIQKPMLHLALGADF